MSTETTETRPYMVTLTGPSGSGKTTILNKLLESGKFTPLISTTTRPPRAGEVDGRDYHFVSRAAFEYGLSQGDFAQHVEFRGNYYGTDRYHIEHAFELGLIPICIVEPSGVDQFKRIGERLNFDVVSVFVTAPMAELLSRYLRRVMDEGAIKTCDNSTPFYENVPYHAERILKLIDEANEWGEPELDANEYHLWYFNQNSPFTRSIPNLVDALTTRCFNVYDFVTHKNDPTQLKSNVSQG